MTRYRRNTVDLEIKHSRAEERLSQLIVSTYLCDDRIFQHTAIYVPGKNTVVSAAIFFMASLSRWAARATRLDSSAIDREASVSARI